MIKDYFKDLNSEKTMQFKEFENLIIDWNKKINITRILDRDEIYIKHFSDSLSLFDTNLFDGNKKIIDVGTGGGFPGIPLKIYNENLDVTLLDALNKRIIFLNEVIDKLNLKDIKAIHGRAEELGRESEYRESFDIATSRAVANLSTLLEYCIPFVKVNGYFIALKGKNFKDELELAKNAINVLGIELIDIKEVELSKEITHYLLIFKKNKKTSIKYPRPANKAKNNPL